MSVQQEKFKLIADKIREKTRNTKLIKPNDFAENIDDVYKAGQNSQQPIIDHYISETMQLNKRLEEEQKKATIYNDELQQTETQIKMMSVEVEKQISQGVEYPDTSRAVSLVYAKGYSDGKSQGGNTEEAYNEGFDAGKKSYYDEFWDDLQQNGARTNYDGGFGGWSENFFKPKYDMKPKSAFYMFSQFRSNIDMVEHLNKCGVSLDFSNCNNFTNFMLWSKILRLGVIDTRSASSVNFYVAYLLETIDLLILKDDGTQTFNFQGCNSLKNMVVEGVFGKNFDMKECPLSKSSIISITNALSPTTSNLTVTFKKTAINEAFGIDVDDEATYPEGSEFYNLRNSKSNWTFSYV